VGYYNAKITNMERFETAPGAKRPAAPDEVVERVISRNVLLDSIEKLKGGPLDVGAKVDYQNGVWEVIKHRLSGDDGEDRILTTLTPVGADGRGIIDVDIDELRKANKKAN